MMTPRFIIDDTIGETPRCVVMREDEHHHLKNVLRLSIGDSIEVISRAEQTAYRATIKSIDKQESSVELEEALAKLPIPKVSLIIGLAKPKVCDEVIEKVTEIGVSAIHFFRAERSQQKLSEEDIKKRLQRWQRISDSALKQSGFHCFPKLNIHPSLDDCLSSLESPQGCILVAPLGNNDPEAPRLTDCFTRKPAQDASFSADSQDTPLPNKGGRLPIELSAENAESYLIVGPEGGLTKNEITKALQHGFFETSIGMKTLRVETAAVFSCALLCSQKVSDFAKTTSD